MLWLGLVAFLLWLMRAQETRQAPHAREAVWGLEIAAGILAPIALLALTGAYGMIRNKQWGWWVALLVDLAIVLMLTYSMIDDGWRNVDPELVTVTAVSVVPVVLLLLPDVRRFYGRKQGFSGPGRALAT
jgi:hypothetical protein